MSINIADILGGGFLDGIKGLIGQFVTDPTEKLKLEARAQELASAAQAQLEQTYQKEIEAKQAIMVAELNQDDNYTKRARPTIIYVGLGAMLINNVFLPWLAFFTKSSAVPPAIEIPSIFWEGWIGVCGLYVIGRTAEKNNLALPFMKHAPDEGAQK